MKIGQKLTVAAWVYQSKRGLDKITKFTEEAFYPIVNIEISFFFIAKMSGKTHLAKSILTALKPFEV